MRKSYKPHNDCDRIKRRFFTMGVQSGWSPSTLKKIWRMIRDQRGYLNPYILGASAPLAGFDKTDLMAWLNLDEESGVRYDAHGDNDLTDNNTCGYAAGKVGNAVETLRANSEYLSIVSNSTLQTGDIDFTVGGWVYFYDLTAGFYPIAVSKWGAGVCEYALLYVPDVQRFRFNVSPDGTAIVSTDANNFGAPSINTWYLIMGWHDSVNNTINIQINNGTADSVAHTTGVLSSNAPFYIGTEGTTHYLNGLSDSVFFTKRLYDSDERTWLYNSGAGRAYSEL